MGCLYPLPSSALSRLLSFADETGLGQIIYNLLDALLHAQKVCPDGDFRRFGCLVRRRDAREVLDLSSAGLLVQPLGISLLGLGKRNVNEYLDEGKRVVSSLCRICVEVTRDLAVGAVR